MPFTKSQSEKYLKLAEAARADAQKALDRNVREGFLRIARDYERMAQQAERLDMRIFGRVTSHQNS